jgi:RNA polymerase sigma factor (sigma-70 family)
VTIKNWLFAIAKSVIRDLVARKSGLRYNEPNPIYLDDENTNLKNKITAPETLETKDSNLGEITSELLLFAESNADREILIAHYIKEVPIPEIAKLHNCEPQAMRVRLFRARQKLLKNYYKKYPEKK